MSPTKGAASSSIRSVVGPSTKRTRFLQLLEEGRGRSGEQDAPLGGGQRAEPGLRIRAVTCPGRIDELFVSDRFRR